MSNEEDKTTKKTIRDYPVNQLSPFVSNDIHVTKDNKFSVNIILDENKNTYSRNLTGLHIVDKENAIELYGQVLKDKLNITMGGINVFEYIYNKLQKSEEKYSMTIKIDFDDCKNVCGYSSTQSVWYGLAELLEKDIIARSSRQTVYHLNPTFFKPADRIVVTEFYKIQ